MKSLRIPAEHDVADMQNHPEFLKKVGVHGALADPSTPVSVSVTMAYVSQEYQAAADAGKRIKEERERRGWTQRDLAPKAGTTQQTIARIERGETVHSRAIPAIKAALGLTQQPPTSVPSDDSASYIWILADEASTMMTRSEAERQAFQLGRPAIIARVVSQVTINPKIEVVP